MSLTFRSRRRGGFSLIEVMVALFLFGLLATVMVQFLVPTMRISSRGALRAEIQQQGILALSTLSEDMENSSSVGITMSGARYAAPPGATPVALPDQSAVQIAAVQTLSDISASPTGKAVGVPAAQQYTQFQQWGKFNIYNWDPSKVPSEGGQYTSAPLEPQGGDLTETFDVPNPTSTAGGLDYPFPVADLASYDTVPSGVQTRVLAHGVVQFQILLPKAALYKASSITSPPCPCDRCVTTVSEPILLYIQLQRIGATGATKPEMFETQRMVTMRNRDSDN